MRKIAILNYGIGNVKSIYNALAQINARPILTNRVEEIREADGVILPGVGAFASGMENLAKYELEGPISDYVQTGKPFLGICLGMQMLMDESEEFGHTRGLGLVNGKVIRLKVTHARLPHVGWSKIEQPAHRPWSDTIFQDIKTNTNLYFVHSFAVHPKNTKDVLSLTTYDDNTYCSAFGKDNVYGVQFHPEKSADMGLKILKNFINL